MESRFIGSGVVKGIGAALKVGMGLMWDVGIGLEGNIVEVEVGGTIIGRGRETASPLVSPVGLEAF